VKVQRAADAGSHHELLLAKVKARISRGNQTRPQKLRRYNTRKLTSAAAKEDFFHNPKKQVPNPRRHRH